jgi:SAM-dependent methyltransferase
MLLGLLIVVVMRRTGSRPPRGPAVTAVLLLIVPVGLLGVLVERTLNPCERETAYFCARVIPDLAPCTGGLTLYLDTLRHSCVHPNDPQRLDFTYAQIIGDVIAAVAPDGTPVDALHIGGGGFTMPRYLQSANPGSTSLVLELDPALVQIARDELGLQTSPDLQVRVGDARLGIREAADDSFDLAIGDAFGGLAVPWHLATREFVEQVDRVLRPGGTYVINVIDHPPLGFVRAEAATLGAVFEHVAVIAPADRLAGRAGGNMILVASHEPIPVPEILAHNAGRGDDDSALTGPALRSFIGDSRVLTDDFAPVDQLLSPAR